MAARNAFTEALDTVKKLTSRAGGIAGGKVNQTVDYFNPNKGVIQQSLKSPTSRYNPAPKVKSFWTDIPQVDPWRAVNNVPKVSLPQSISTPSRTVNRAVNRYLNNPVSNFARPIAEDVINTPANLVQGAMRATGGAIERKPQQILGGVGQYGASALNVLPVGTGVSTVKGLAKPTISQAIKQGAKIGAIYGGAQGIGRGLEYGISAKSVDEQLEEAMKQGLIGAVGGAVGGTALGAGAAGTKALKDKIWGGLTSDIQKLHPDWSPKQVQEAGKRWLINPYTGKFAGSIKKTGADARQFVVGPDRKGVQNSFSLTDADRAALANKWGYGSKGAGLSVKTVTPEESAAMGRLQGEGQSVSKQSNTQDYINELVKKQQAAEKTSIPGSIYKKGQDFLSDIKRKMVDSTAPIEDVLSAAQKKYKYDVLPANRVDLQIDRVLRAPVLAGQFAKDKGLDSVIREAPDLNAFNQYLIAKQAKTVAGKGIETGRDLARDEQLVQDLAPQYEQLAQRVNQYTRELLQYSTDQGLISKDLQQKLIQEYPEYVPLNRVFDEVEKAGVPGVTTKPLASLSRQSVVQKIKGSEREIVNPLESILSKTVDAFNQGERNKAAKMLASYKDLPGFEGLIKEGEGTHTFSYLDNGVKKTFETTPEIAAAAKSLSQEQLGLIGKIFSGPTRVLQLGATGLNLPFLVTNLAKDQVTSFINGSNAARSSLLNPINFGRALFSAARHDKLYDEVVRNAAGGTSYDIARNAPKLTVDAIRSQRSGGAKAKYLVRNPGELLRAVENLVGRGEELTRIQQYSGNKSALLSKGRTPQDAQLLAAEAARNNTANFARKGDWGRVVNGIIPFFNAGIQGARQLDRSFQNKPVATAFKTGLTVFTPVAIATAWNLSDPERKQIYEDIDKFEKDNNLVIIPPGAVKDDKGSYGVIKIPIPPGLSNLAALIRRPMEASQGLDPVAFSEVANNLFTAATSVDVSSPNKIASSFTPQAVKPFVETATNTNLFTGKQIVPEYMKGNPPAEQVKRYTSGTARALGGVIGASPLHVENAVKTVGGGLGGQLLNAGDTLLNKVGAIPSEQVSGENPLQNLQRRFGKASGGATLDKAVAEQTVSNAKTRTEALKLYESLQGKPREEILSQLAQVKQTNPELLAKLKDIGEEKALNRSSDEGAMMQLGVVNRARAKYIYQQTLKLPVEQRREYLLNLRRKKILTDQVLSQLKEVGANGGQ